MQQQHHHQHRRELTIGGDKPKIQLEKRGRGSSYGRERQQPILHATIHHLVEGLLSHQNVSQYAGIPFAPQIVDNDLIEKLHHHCRPRRMRTLKLTTEIHHSCDRKRRRHQKPATKTIPSNSSKRTLKEKMRVRFNSIRT